LNFQGADGLKDNWAVMADGFFAGEGSGTSKGSGYLLSGGFGHYRPIGTRFVWDTYGILGYGHVENHFAGRDVSSSLVRYGVQPSFGFQSKFFDTAIGARLVGLRYFSANGDPIEVQYLKDAGTQYLFEPALTVRVGYDVVKVQAQFGHSYNLTNRNFRQDRDIASLGIVYTFGRN
jgi:hypothetical protein